MGVSCYSYLAVSTLMMPQIVLYLIASINTLMHGYVYITTNLVNGMKYIGKRTSHVFNPRYFGSGIRIKNAVKLYGKDKFAVELLIAVHSREELEEAEKRVISEHDAVVSPRYYNLAQGGSGGLLYTDRRRHIEPHMRRSAERYADLEEMLKTMTQRQVADALGVSQGAVAQRIREHGVAVCRGTELQATRSKQLVRSAKLAHAARRAQGAQTWEGYDLAAMYETMTQAEMAEVIGVSQVRVSQKLREHGLTKRSRTDRE
jgi:predicted transcriptional regulator